MTGGHPPPPTSTLLHDADSAYHIGQSDGNISLDSSSSAVSQNESESFYDLFNQTHPIPTQAGYRPNKIIYERPPHSRKTIRRDNKSVQALTLPKISNYNMRSLFLKIGNFALDMEERESDLCFLTEVWEKQENKKHQFRLVELFEMSGIKYISTPRPGSQRGGGAAIAVRLDKFTVKKLNIQIPKSVEVVWGLLKPTVTTGKISTIIACCFYSPPRSRKNAALIDHITVTLQSLLNIHTNAGVIISGDRNSIEISALLSIDPSLRQTVLQPSRGDKILDVIVTNLARYFNEPVIVPPIQPDRPGHGAPSDHSGVVATPNTTLQPANRIKVEKNIRPLSESLIQLFNDKLAKTSFTNLNVYQFMKWSTNLKKLQLPCFAKLSLNAQLQYLQMTNLFSMNS